MTDSGYEARVRDDLAFWERKLAGGELDADRRYTIEGTVASLRAQVRRIEARRELRGRDVD